MIGSDHDPYSCIAAVSVASNWNHAETAAV